MWVCVVFVGISTLLLGFVYMIVFVLVYFCVNMEVMFVENKALVSDTAPRTNMVPVVGVGVFVGLCLCFCGVCVSKEFIA